MSHKTEAEMIAEMDNIGFQQMMQKQRKIDDAQRIKCDDDSAADVNSL